MAAVVVVGLLLGVVLPMNAAQAAGWPSVFHAYGRFDGTTFNDPIEQPAGNAIADLSSGVETTVDGPLPSTYVAADGTDLLVRFRLKTTPGSTSGVGGWDASKGGLTNFAYVVQLAVNGTHVASVGLDGKTAAEDYVYVAPVTPVTVGAVTYTASSPRVVSTWNGTEIPGARVSSAGTAAAPEETFLDFRVPLADIALVAPSITPTTPLQFFYGTSAAANLTTINKDFMSNAGDTCAEVGCAEVIIGPSRIGLAWTDTPTHVSGPNPPTTGAASAYDLTVTARNTGLNELSSIKIVDALPSGTSVVTATTASGTVDVTGQRVQWLPGTLAPGQTVTMTVRVSVTPGTAVVGQMATLSPGPSATAVDAASATSSSAALDAVTVGAVVAGDADPPASEAPTEQATTPPTETATVEPTDEPTVDPTDTVTEAPPAPPSGEPTPPPTDEPTDEATDQPTDEPTDETTDQPTDETTDQPTDEPTDQPTDEPTDQPTDEPTDETTDEPTDEPSDGVDTGTDPVAVDDMAGGRTGEVVTVDVLANDTAPGSTLDPASVTVAHGMAHGDILGVDAVTGAVTYRPDADYQGVDGFSYRVCNVSGRCATADVSTATPPVDLEVKVERLGLPVRVGATATYEVSVTNLGPRVAEAPLTLDLATSGLAAPHAEGRGWLQPANVARYLPSRSSAFPLHVFAAETIVLELPHDLVVGRPLTVTLAGIVTGSAGGHVRVDAVLAGPTIELEYANNESSARDTILDNDTGTTPPDPDKPNDPLEPNDPDEPNDPVDPSDPQEPTDAGPTGGDGGPPGDGATAGAGTSRVPPVDASNHTLAATGAHAVTLLAAGLGFLFVGTTLRRRTTPQRR